MKMQFILEKETKGAVRYQEVTRPGSDAKIGSFYVRKSAFRESVPQRIVVTIEEFVAEQV